MKKFVKIETKTLNITINLDDVMLITDFYNHWLGGKTLILFRNGESYTLDLTYAEVMKLIEE